MLVEHKITGNVYYLDEFISGVRIRNYTTGEVRMLDEEDFKENYHLVEEDFLYRSDSVVDDVIKEIKNGKRVKNPNKKPKKKVKIKVKRK